jgi:hypothetical protein
VKLHVKDMAGKGLEQSALYLERVLSIQVRTNAAWCHIVDLRLLRNLIVHRGGKRRESKEQNRDIETLIGKYPQHLQFQNADGIQEQIWISMNLCRNFAQSIDEFFEKIFKSAGIASRQVQPDKPTDTPDLS